MKQKKIKSSKKCLEKKLNLSKKILKIARNYLQKIKKISIIKGIKKANFLTHFDEI